MKARGAAHVVIASYSVLALAALGLVFVGGWSRHPEIALACHVAAGCAWVVAWRASERSAPAPAFLLGGAVLLRVLALLSHLDTSDDVQRYVWEGEVVLRGSSPYAFAPADPALESVRAELPVLARGVAHPDIPAIYPPLVQAVGAGTAVLVHAADGTLERDGPRLLRFLFAAADLLVLLPLMSLLARAGRPPGALVAWAWCPLVAFEFGGAGHFDALGIVLLLAAVLAWDRDDERGDGRVGWRGAALLAGAVLVKYVPVVALPWAGHRAVAAGSERDVTAGSSRVAVRRIALVLAFVALAFVPFLFLAGGDRGLVGGAGTYGSRWEAGSLVFRFVRGLCGSWPVSTWWWIHPYELPRIVVALAWLAWAFVVVRRERSRARGIGLLIAGFLFLSPTLHPWYLTWIVPFVALRPSAAWTWLVAAAGILYAPLASWQLHGAWTEPAWMWPAIALPFFVLAIAPFNWTRALRKLCGEP